MRRWSHNDVDHQKLLHHHHHHDIRMADHGHSSVSGSHQHHGHGTHHHHHHHHHNKHHHSLHQSFDEQEESDETLPAFWNAIAASMAAMLCLLAYSAYQSVLQPLLVPAVIAIGASMVLHPVKTALLTSFESACKYVASKRSSFKKIVQDHCKELVKAYGVVMKFSCSMGVATIGYLVTSGRLKRDFEKAWKVHVQPKPLESRVAMGMALAGLIILGSIAVLKREQICNIEGNLRRQKSRRRKTSKESKQNEKLSLVPQISSPAGIMRRFLRGLTATLTHYLQVVDKTLKAAVLGILSRVASWVGLKSKVPAPLLAFLKEKSPSRKDDVLSVPRTFTRSKYRRHRRDSERRCSLPTISEDEAGKAAGATKRLQSRFPRSTEDLRFRAAANSLQQKRIVDMGSHPAMAAAHPTPSHFPREGSPFPSGCQTGPPRRKLIFQRSFSNPSDEDEGYEDDDLHLEPTRSLRPAEPTHGLHMALAGTSILGIPIQPVTMQGSWCCQMNPVFKPRFGNFLMPPDILETMMPLASNVDPDAACHQETDTSNHSQENEEVLIRSRANSDTAIHHFRKDSISSQDSSCDSNDEYTNSTMTIDEDEPWSESLPAAEPTFTVHWLVGIIWYRMLCMQKLGNVVLCLLPLIMMIAGIQKLRLINVEILEEHLDLIYYHWCVKWRERRHLMLPKPLLSVLRHARSGYRTMWQLYRESLDALASIFTILLTAVVVIMVYLGTKDVIEQEAASSKHLADQLFEPLLEIMKNFSIPLQRNSTMPEVNVSEEWMEAQDMFLTMLEDQLQNMLNATNNSLVTTAVATALTTGNALISSAIGTEASIIPEPQALEASNMTNIWANLHVEGEFVKSAAAGQLLAWAVQHSLELWIIFTMVYQLLKQKRNEVWCLIASLFEWLVEIKELAFPEEMEASNFIATAQDSLASIFSAQRMQEAFFSAMWIWTVLENVDSSFLFAASVLAGILVAIPVAPCILTIVPTGLTLWLEEANMSLGFLCIASVIGMSHSSISAFFNLAVSSSWRSRAKHIVSIFGATLALACIVIARCPPGSQMTKAR